MPQICFDTGNFYAVVLTGITIIVFVVYSIYQEKVTEAKLALKDMELDRARDSDPIIAPDTHDIRDLALQRAQFAAQVQNLEDLQRMVHPLSPPLRRGPFGYTGHSEPVLPVSMPTRGEYGSFQQNGYLYNAGVPDQAMPLMGRRIHSNQYEYYTFHHNNPQIKIPIKIPGNKEINDGESVQVLGYPQQFQVKIYELDSPRYIPY